MTIDTHKVVFYNKNEISVHTTEEVHANKMNHWKDWYCSAGLRSLYINFDGMMYIGTCQVGGPLKYGIYGHNAGVINAENGKTWIKCDVDVCACASDWQSPKVKNLADTDLADLWSEKKIDFDKFTKVDKVDNPDAMMIPVGLYDYKMVIWEIGRRCNYDCWYCYPSSHNTYEGHKTLGTFMNAYNNLKKFWSKEYRMKFVFTGGEPTFNPDYLEFVENLKKDDHIIHTTTNGSQTPEYYGKLMRLSDMSFSAHIQYLEANPRVYARFLENVKTCATMRKNDAIARLHWLDAKIMLEPGKLEFAKKLFTDLRAIIAHVNVDVLHSGEGKVIMKYSKEEIDWLNSANAGMK